MIQEIGERKFDNQYRPGAVARDDDYIFVIRRQERGDGIYIKNGEQGIEVPQKKEFNVKQDDLRYLFAIDDSQFFLLKTDAETELPEGYAFESLRALRSCEPDWLCMAGMTANHLHIWYRNNHYCGRCGAPTVHDDNLRALNCLKCGNMIFPRLNPAVTVALRNGDSLMVSRYAGRPMSAGLALIAGFVEIGESNEECVAREVMEEVGLKVKNIQYYGSQPWGFVGNLQMGYVCDVDGDTTVTLDEEELASAEFVKRDELPEPASMASLTATMIEDFRKGRL